MKRSITYTDKDRLNQGTNTMPSEEELDKMYRFAKAIKSMVDSPANKQFFERLRQQQPSQSQDKEEPQP